jgi:hypothetical protein
VKLVPFFMFCAILSACGWGPWKKSHDDQPTKTPTENLADKRQAYLNLNVASGDEFGFVHSKCDSVGFTSLCKAGGGCARANIFLAEDNGKWFRDAKKSCYPTDSATTISKDMLLMIMSYLWELSKTDQPAALSAVNRLINYGQSHNWLMGEPTDSADAVSRVLMSPGLVSLLKDMKGKIEGSAHLVVASQPTVKDFSLAGSLDDILAHTGFTAHLDVLFVLLTGRVYGAISGVNLGALKRQAERQPENAFYQAALHRFTDGDQTVATELLDDPNVFPPDRLPGSKDHCTEFLYQRDSGGADWAPCPDEGGTFSGADFLFASAVITEHVVAP